MNHSPFYHEQLAVCRKIYYCLFHCLSLIYTDKNTARYTNPLNVDDAWVDNLSL